MNNQDFLYFVWGTHDHVNSSFYALLDTIANKFYLTGEDYETLKLLQFILIPTKHLLLVNLSGINNYELQLLDNSVCLMWGLDSSLTFTRPSTGSSATYKNTEYIKLKQHNIPITEADLELQKILLLLLRILDATKNFVNDQVDLHVDIKHTTELRKFCKIVLPDDQALQEMITIDEELILTLKTKIEECRSDVIRILSALDYNVSYYEFINGFKSIINNTTYYSMIKSNYKTHLLQSI